MRVNRLQHDLLKQLLYELEKAGVTPDQLFSRARLRGYSASGEGAFAGVDSLVLLETAVQLTGDPCLAIRFGQGVGIASYGVFGFALMSCANLRESISLMLRYGKVWFETNWELHDYDGGLLLRLELAQGTPVQQSLATELCFSQLSFIGSSLYRGRLEGAELRLNSPRPPHSAYFDATLKAAVKYDCEHSELFLPAQVLDMPVRTASPSEHVVYHQQCEEMLRGLDSVEKTTAAVRQLLIQSAGEFLDIAQVADSLHVSERTLRRRLEAESTSFRTTFEEVRDLLAREYLAETELTVAEIAHLLDYSETVNFRRAFVRWNGVTPSEHRQQQVA
ncbi:MAG: helix-turn-helix domain-containing protein [Halieaceae bacterium]|nr:helix-turn-helix domain-containing protein [Halieaceae bacterium]